MPDTGTRRPPLAGEVVVVLVLVFVYDRIRDMAANRPTLAVKNGQHMLGMEQDAHLDIEHRLNDFLSLHSSLETGTSWYYQLMHLTVTLAVLLACYWLRPRLYPQARNALVAINVMGLAVYWAFPAAPPRLLPGAGFIDSTVVSGVAEKTTTITPDVYAAMPSLHVAWAVWVVLLVWRMYPISPLRLLAVVHAAVTVFVVISTANHYVLDVLVGAALGFGAMVAFNAPPERDEERAEVPASREAVLD